MSLLTTDLLQIDTVFYVYHFVFYMKVLNVLKTAPSLLMHQKSNEYHIPFVGNITAT